MREGEIRGGKYVNKASPPSGREKPGQERGAATLFCPYMYIYGAHMSKLYTVNTISLWPTPSPLDTNFHGPTGLTPLAQRGLMQCPPQAGAELVQQGEARVSGKGLGGQGCPHPPPKTGPSFWPQPARRKGPHHPPSLFHANLLQVRPWLGAPTESRAG